MQGFHVPILLAQLGWCSFLSFQGLVSVIKP
jgi:hypothetical protein